MCSQMRSGEGVWGLKTQNQAGSLVLGLPSQTVMVGGRGWWWCVPIEVVVPLLLHAHMLALAADAAATASCTAAVVVGRVRAVPPLRIRAPSR